MSELDRAYNGSWDPLEMGHQMEGMLLDCAFQKKQCFPTNFTRWEHPRYPVAIWIRRNAYLNLRYGNCFTFFPPTMTSKPGYFASIVVNQII